MCRLGGKGRRVAAIGREGGYGAGAALGARVAVLMGNDYMARGRSTIVYGLS